MRRLVLVPVVLLVVLAMFIQAGKVAHAEEPLNAEGRAIARSLLCPVCENVPVLDSPSPLAQQMRGIIQEKLAAGESREQIIQFFVDRYGEGVLVEPPKRGFSLLVWLGPLLVGIAGLSIVGFSLRRWLAHRASVSEIDDEEPVEPASLERLEAELRRQL